MMSTCMRLNKFNGVEGWDQCVFGCCDRAAVLAMDSFGRDKEIRDIFWFLLLFVVAAFVQTYSRGW